MRVSAVQEGWPAKSPHIGHHPPRERVRPDAIQHDGLPDAKLVLHRRLREGRLKPLRPASSAKQFWPILAAPTDVHHRRDRWPDSDIRHEHVAVDTLTTVPRYGPSNGPSSAFTPRVAAERHSARPMTRIRTPVIAPASAVRPRRPTRNIPPGSPRRRNCISGGARLRCRRCRQGCRLPGGR